MNFRLTGGYVILLGEGGFEVKKQDIYVINGKVRYTAGTDKVDREIDCEGKIIMPGLVNGHHHIFHVFQRDTVQSALW